MNPTQTLAAREEAVVKRIRQLKRERGAAILDGRPFDSSEFGRLSAELDDIHAAQEEGTRRLRAEQPRIAARSYAKHLEGLRAAGADRVAALKRVEKATRDLAPALADAMTAAKTMREHAAAMENIANPGHHESPTPINEPNHSFRIWSYMRGVLRSALGNVHFGELNIGPQPGDLPADQSWGDAEQRLVNFGDHFERNAPRVPADDEREAA
jgi:hypothetical protein